MKCILKYFRIHLYIFICTHSRQYHQNTAKVLFIVQRLPLKWRICSGWCFQTYLNWIQELQFFSFRFLTVFALLEWNICCADFRFFHSRNPLLFIPYFYSFLFLIQPPRAESIFLKGSSIMCASLWFFLVVTSEAKHKACNFLPQASKTSLMTNKCCHVKVCDSYILCIAEKHLNHFNSRMLLLICIGLSNWFKQKMLVQSQLELMFCLPSLIYYQWCKIHINLLLCLHLFSFSTNYQSLPSTLIDGRTWTILK